MVEGEAELAKVRTEVCRWAELGVGDDEIE